MNINDNKPSFSLIGKEIGVSTAVVSSVMRNTSSTTNAGSETKKRILETAWIRGLRLNQNIGVVVPEYVKTNEALYYPGFSGIAERCAQLGLGLFSSVIKNPDDIPDFIVRREVSGIIIWNEAGPALLKTVSTEKIPAVMLNPVSGFGEADGVVFSDYATMSELLDYLLQKGYRRYIYITLKRQDSFNFQTSAAFNDFAQRTHWDCRLLTPEKSDSFEVVASLEKLVESADRSTVFIAPGRFYTMKLLELFARHNMKFPDDVGLVGSSILAEYYNPGITTVRYPFYEMGMMSVDILEEKWETRHFMLNRQKTVNGIIVKNQSTQGE